MASARARWRKVWADLWSTPSLLHLDHSTLYLLVFLIVHAEWEPGCEEGSIQWGYDRDTRIMKIRKMARMHHRTMAKSMDALVAEKCIRVDDSGIYLPNYGKWQETSDAARKRRTRTGHSDGHSAETPSTSTSPSTSPSDLKADLHDRAAQIPTRGSQLASELSDLAMWRTYGKDPAGLGAWPEPQPPTGPTLHRLTTHKVGTLLADVSAAEIHAFVHALSQAVEGGGFPPDKYTSNYVFDPRTFPSVRAQVDAWHAEQKRKAAEAEQAALSAPAQLSQEDRAKLVF